MRSFLSFLILTVCFSFHLAAPLSANAIDPSEVNDLISWIEDYAARADRMARDAASSAQLGQQALRVAGQEAEALRNFEEAETKLREASRLRGIAQTYLERLRQLRPAAAILEYGGLLVRNSAYLVERVAYNFLSMMNGLSRATFGPALTAFIRRVVGAGALGLLGVLSYLSLPMFVADAVLGFGAGTANAAEPEICSITQCGLSNLDWVCGRLSRGPSELAVLSASCHLQESGSSAYYTLLSSLLNSVSEVRARPTSNNPGCQAELDIVYNSIRASEAYHRESCGIQAETGNSCLLQSNLDNCRRCCTSNQNATAGCSDECHNWFNYDRCTTAARRVVANDRRVCPSGPRFLGSPEVDQLLVPGITPAEQFAPLPSIRSSCELHVSFEFGTRPFSPQDQASYDICVGVCEESIADVCLTPNATPTPVPPVGGGTNAGSSLLQGLIGVSPGSVGSAGGSVSGGLIPTTPISGGEYPTDW